MKPDSPYGVIYLQASPHREIETTWCSDQITDDDIKYLLATPEREAAPELLEALEGVMPILNEAEYYLPGKLADGEILVHTLVQKARAAIAKAKRRENET
jgi:hypothetical protein